MSYGASMMPPSLSARMEDERAGGGERVTGPLEMRGPLNTMRLGRRVTTSAAQKKTEEAAARTCRWAQMWRHTCSVLEHDTTELKRSPSGTE